MAAWEQAGVGLTRAWRQRRLRRGLLGLAAATLGAAALQQREGGTAVAAPISGDSSSAVTAGVTGTNSAINGTGVSGNASGDGGTAVSGVSTSTSG
ncbi:MAG TPA: hypothetical protein VEQ11_03485, partial [Chloroflexota bacterium]|nr:hypothetical protein [Chloroflexota bacterium]